MKKLSDKQVEALKELSAVYNKLYSIWDDQFGEYLWENRLIPEMDLEDAKGIIDYTVENGGEME